MDKFHEEVVTKKGGKILSTILYYFSWVVTAITGLIAASLLMSMVSSMSFQLVNVILTLASGGVALLFFRNKDNLRTEYEYTYTAGDMDFARVMGNVRRKHIFTINLKNVEVGGLVSGQKYARYSSMKDSKVHDFTLNNDDGSHIFLFMIRDGQKQLILMEPTPKMMELMRQSNPRTIDFAT